MGYSQRVFSVERGEGMINFFGSYEVENKIDRTVLCPYHKLKASPTGKRHNCKGGYLYTCPKGCYFCSKCEVEE
jgi:hypothetical protein